MNENNLLARILAPSASRTATRQRVHWGSVANGWMTRPDGEEVDGPRHTHHRHNRAKRRQPDPTYAQHGPCTRAGNAKRRDGASADDGHWELPSGVIPPAPA